MNNGYQKSNGCGADKEGRKFFKTFFYPNAQSRHVRPLAYNNYVNRNEVGMETLFEEDYSCMSLYHGLCE